MELKNRKVKMFRAHYDPGIGPMPKNAFMLSDPTMKMEGELTPVGVYVKVLSTGRMHLVPFANIQSVELFPEEIEEIRKPGRPKDVQQKTAQS